MLETSLVARLAPITTALYPLVAPKNYATPCVVYNRSDTKPVADLKIGTDAAKVWLQVDVYDVTYLGAKALADMIRKNLEMWVDVEVQAVSWTNEQDMIDETTETMLYRAMLSFEVFVNIQ
jgi:hypothetical protein